MKGEGFYACGSIQKYGWYTRMVSHGAPEVVRISKASVSIHTKMT